ncbi:MAG: chloride channel protein, partial [Planctomycetes bacterium]|nr:chloride channel protein [Planctomycetota bacterium]
MPRPKGTPLSAFAIFLLAAVIGVSGGLLGSLFQHGLSAIQHAFTGLEPGEDLSDAVRSNLDWWQTLLLPAAGGLVSGLVILLLRGNKPPFGIADLVVLVQLRKGAIRLRESLVQIVASACTIGTGGSIGKEGANSQIAATIASLLARWTRLGSRPRAVLVGCGVAAGMATSYNAPIAGAIFVMEVVLGNFAMDVFAPIVVASVLATMVRGEYLGTGAIYGGSLPTKIGTVPSTLVLTAILLGVFCGFGGVLFRAALRGARRAFAALRLPPPIALALGGLVVGGIGVFMPETWGNGFEVIDDIAHGPTAVLVLTLFFWKVVATCGTVGSGGLGGIFTPNLVIGAALGTFFVYGLDALHPGSPTAPDVLAEEFAVFTFVGMAGLTSATMHAPVTAVVLIFELTGHYEIVMPAMLCSIVASIASSIVDQDSYYTAAIRAKGEEVPSGIEDMAIRSTFVRDVMRGELLTVRDTASFEEVMRMLGEHRGDTIYVQDQGGALIGRIELQDVKNFINDPTLSSVVIAADLTRPAITASPDDSIAALMPRFEDPELREIAIVRGKPARLVGRVRHLDVITTIGSEVLGPQR